MLQKQFILPVGGLNTDDDPRYLPEGDYIKMLNMRSGFNMNQGDKGTVESIISTFEIQMPIGGSVEHICKAVDSESNEIFIISADSNFGVLFITKFSILTDAAKLIYSGTASEWGMNTLTKTYNACILDRNLIWTDNVNPIRMVNVDRLEKSYDNGIGVSGVVNIYYSDAPYNENDIVYYRKSYYKSLENANQGYVPDLNPTKWEELCDIIDAYGDISDPDKFTLSANPPLLAINPAYMNISGRSVNHLRHQTFQFAYRYIYIDFRKSTYSPPSIIAAPSQEENTDGSQISDPNYHNAISLSVPTGSEDIRTIEVICRGSSDPTTWFKIAEIQMFDRSGNRVVAPNTTYPLRWYNDEIKNAVDTSEVNTLFTYIPIKAKHMELINGNRLVFGNITEGHDRIQHSVRISLSYSNAQVQSTPRYSISVLPEFINSYFQEGDDDPTFIYRLYINLPSEARFGRYRIYIVTAIGYVYTAYFDYTTGPYPLTVKNGLLSAITTAGWINMIVSGGTNYQIVGFETHVGETEEPYQGWDLSGSYYEDTTALALNKYPALKKGASHSWGFIYRDNAGRITPIIGAGEITKYIPFQSENSSSNADAIPEIDFYISHKPPAMAKSYEIVYMGNKTASWFLQLYGLNLSYGKKPTQHDIPTRLNPDTRYLRISLQDMYSKVRSNLPSWSVEQYSWVKGDRIRIIGKVGATGVLVENSIYYDAEILGVFTDTDYENVYNNSGTTIQREYLYFQFLANKGLTPLSTPNVARGWEDYLVEIYRPYKEFQKDLYYTTGMTYEIGTDQYGNLYHKGNENQVFNSAGVLQTPARVRNRAHDSWIYIRPFIDKMNDDVHKLWIESQYASDFYQAGVLTSKGIPIPDLDNIKQVSLSKRIRHGGQYSYGTQINNISKFDYDDYLDLDDNYGPIEGMRMRGYALKIIQNSKVASVYIGVRESYSPSGEANYQFTDKIFGSIRYEIQNWGTSHPDSVCIDNNSLYFWDHKEGVVVRDSVNGMIAISSYKMNRFFKEKANYLDLFSPENHRVFFVFSNEESCLYCTFGQSQTSVYETAVFYEPENRWKFTTDAKINHPISIGRRLYHLYGLSIFEWWRDEDQGFLNLGADQLSAEMIVVGNDNTGKIKVYKSIAVYQDGDAPSASVNIPQKMSAVGRDMETEVGPWTQREGVYYGIIQRDVNTPGIQGNANLKRLNGIPMRGQCALITLEVTKTDGKVRIFSIMVNSTISERSM